MYKSLYYLLQKQENHLHPHSPRSKSTTQGSASRLSPKFCKNTSQISSYLVTPQLSRPLFVIIFSIEYCMRPNKTVLCYHHNPSYRTKHAVQTFVKHIHTFQSY